MSNDPQWRKYQLGDDTSVNLAAAGSITIKQSTGGLVETVHLSADQAARLVELLRHPPAAPVELWATVVQKGGA